MRTETGADPAIPDRRAPALLEIGYFTDPLCCWSWGLEPQIRRLRYAFAGRIAWRLRLGGMIGSWSGFSDPLNSVHRPAQMGPVWMQAAELTGMPNEARLWVEDPPASSWPACLAVKAAALQSSVAGDRFLRRLREAVMLENRNIAREEVLAALAREVGYLDVAQFERDLAARAPAALEEDVREARYRGIGRYPCLLLRRAGCAPAYLVGWRPYAALVRAVEAFAPELGPERPLDDAEAYRRYWGGGLPAEAALALDGGTAAEASPGPLSSGAGA